MAVPRSAGASRKAELDVDGPMGGELAAMVQRVSATPPSVVKRVEGIFKKFPQEQ